VNLLDEILPEAGAFYVMDRGYIDFQRLFVFTLSSAFFVVRTKSNVLLERRYSHPVDKSTGVRSDQTVILSSFVIGCDFRPGRRRWLGCIRLLLSTGNAVDVVPDFGPVKPVATLAGRGPTLRGLRTGAGLPNLLSNAAAGFEDVTVYAVLRFPAKSRLGQSSAHGVQSKQLPHPQRRFANEIPTGKSRTK